MAPIHGEMHVQRRVGSQRQCRAKSCERMGLLTWRWKQRAWSIPHTPHAPQYKRSQEADLASLISVPSPSIPTQPSSASPVSAIEASGGDRVRESRSRTSPKKLLRVLVAQRRSQAPDQKWGLRTVLICGFPLHRPSAAQFLNTRRPVLAILLLWIWRAVYCFQRLRFCAMSSSQTRHRRTMA